MKFSTSIFSTFAFLSTSKDGQIFTSAFAPSRNNNNNKIMQPYSYAGLMSNMQVSMVAASNEETDTFVSNEPLGYWDINNLTYRQLQKTCKDKGLAANGSTAVLRTRLLQNLGIYKEGEECVTNSEGEDVSRLYGLFPTMQYMYMFVLSFSHH